MLKFSSNTILIYTLYNSLFLIFILIRGQFISDLSYLFPFSLIKLNIWISSFNTFLGTWDELCLGYTKMSSLATPVYESEVNM